MLITTSEHERNIVKVKIEVERKLTFGESTCEVNGLIVIPEHHSGDDLFERHAFAIGYLTREYRIQIGNPTSIESTKNEDGFIFTFSNDSNGLVDIPGN